MPFITLEDFVANYYSRNTKFVAILKMKITVQAFTAISKAA